MSKSSFDNYSNETNSQARKTYEVTTHVAPVLPDSVGRITVNKGDSATISCQVDAVPLPEVKWTKNGVPVVPLLVSGVIKSVIDNFFENVR